MSDSEQLMPHLLFVDPSNWPIESEVLEEWVSDLDAELLANKSQSLPNDALLLSYTADRLTLQCSGTKESPIFIDFIGGQAGFRRKFGGGKGQNIAKAIGMNKKAKPSVLDATGGLGHDAFVFASLGCEVTLIERSPIIAILLEDGLKRALLDREVADIIKHMHLIQGNAIDIMPSLSTNKQLFDVVYLDPMFPHRRKSASVKKEMRLLQKLLGEDTDADELLIPALSLARHRVVIKRPKGASDLGKKEPSYRLKGKSCRYDIHALKSFD